jgi:hypothetical protein
MGALPAHSNNDWKLLRLIPEDCRTWALGTNLNVFGRGSNHTPTLGRQSMVFLQWWGFQAIIPGFSS